MRSQTTIAATPTRIAGVQRHSATGLIARMGSRLSAFTKWRRERAAAIELGRLSDHELRDIGIHRSEIACVVSDGCASGSVRHRMRQTPTAP